MFLDVNAEPPPLPGCHVSEVDLRVQEGCESSGGGGWSLHYVPAGCEWETDNAVGAALHCHPEPTFSHLICVCARPPLWQCRAARHQCNVECIIMRPVCPRGNITCNVALIFNIVKFFFFLSCEGDTVRFYFILNTRVHTIKMYINIHTQMHIYIHAFLHTHEMCLIIFNYIKLHCNVVQILRKPLFGRQRTPRALLTVKLLFPI